jgi:hypothetical protein
MGAPVKWVAELAHVREVSLLGTADLSYWRDRLAMEDLVPAEHSGKARILTVIADSKFMGVPFREMSFSVLVHRPDEATQGDAAFLVHAFSSRRLFAFCERLFFSTPYEYGDVGVSTAVPCFIRLRRGGDVLFGAAMQVSTSAPKREPSHSGEDGWEGPVFLPGKLRGKGDQGKLFFARLRGHTRRYPFEHSSDSMTIGPLPGSKILQALVDSHFAGEEWIIREDAVHAKSKTYSRPQVFVG